MNDSYSNGKHLNSITNGRLNGSIVLNKKHGLNLGLVLVNRSNYIDGGAKGFTEFTGTLGYSYSFGR